MHADREAARADLQSMFPEERANITSFYFNQISFEQMCRITCTVRKKCRDMHELQIPSMTDGGMFSILQSLPAFFRLGSERPAI